jgi:uncharacterized protein YbcC (UPF0753/DUF2309 family)
VDNRHNSRMRGRRLAWLIGADCWPPELWSQMRRGTKLTYIEYNSTLATYEFCWSDRQNRLHRHALKSLKVWFNMYEPGYIDDEELTLLRMKIRMTTA